MIVEPLAIPDVLCLTPNLYPDERGWFFESFNARRFHDATGISCEFVQDNVSRSKKHVLRGLHFQIVQPQGKLVRVSNGAVLDIAVDLRRSSPCFGKWAAVELSAENRRQAWIPAGFAHGFVALHDDTEVQYKTTDYYAPEHERTILWNDPDLAIDWKVADMPIVSRKDAEGMRFTAAETYA